MSYQEDGIVLVRARYNQRLLRIKCGVSPIMPTKAKHYLITMPGQKKWQVINPLLLQKNITKKIQVSRESTKDITE